MAMIIDVVFDEFSIFADQSPWLVQEKLPENPHKRTEHF